MSIRELTSEEIRARVGTRHEVTGLVYPPQGLQPYYDWLLQAVHQLAESSAGVLKVWLDDSSPTAVFVAPGRCAIQSVALNYVGGILELAAQNNSTVYVWAYNNSGQAAIGSAPQAQGWPGSAHIKLAEVTLAAGAITTIVDRRWETILQA